MQNLKKMLSSVTCALVLVALCLALLVPPALAFTWTPQTSGTTTRLRDIAYGGSQFVVVGNSGTILTSPDGVTWTAQTSGITDQLHSIEYGNGMFVVGTNYPGKVYTSTDGMTWSLAFTLSPERVIYDIVFSGGQFVLVGQSGTIYTSPDGTTWTARTSGTFLQLYGVGYGGGQFVAVGTSGTILTSPDGVTWTARTSGTGQDLIGVTYGGSQFVAVGNFGTILTSPDGVTWTVQTSGTMTGLQDIAYGGSQFVAVGYSGVILTSPDGVTWTADTSGVTQGLSGIAYDGSQFVAVGENGTILTGEPTLGPQLALTKSVSPSSAKPGEAITYTIAFSNTGAITATNVVITDTLSAHITNPGWSSSGVTLTPIAGQTYAWTAPDLLQGEGGVITITGVLAKPLAAGTVPNTVTLAVSGTVQTANAPLTVENVAPVANAGVDQTRSVSSTVTLDGSGSSDDNGDTLTYGWAQTGGTPTVTLSNPAAQSPTFTAPSAATVLTFTLTVTDTGGLADTDEVVVTVSEGYIYYFPIMFKNATVP